MQPETGVGAEGKLVRTAALEVMFALLGGPSHGYGIYRHLRERAVVCRTIHVGSVYRILERLSREGLVEPEPPGASGAQRYRLTGRGRDACGTMAHRLTQLIDSAGAVPGRAPTGHNPAEAARNGQDGSP